MRDSVRAAFVEFTAKFEGVVPWMYQDVKGLVSIGIGNLIDPIQMAMALPFVHMDGSSADRAEIAAEWLRIKNYPNAAALGHRAVEHVAQLRLTAGGVQDLVARELARMDAQLAGRFPGYPAWPADAQLGTLSMAWACGPGFRFPKLAAALNARDFSTAAGECHMDDLDNPGLRPRNAANVVLYRNAATVVAGGTDPDILHWPVQMSEEPTVPDFAIVYILPDPVRIDLPDPDDEPEAA